METAGEITQLQGLSDRLKNVSERLMNAAHHSQREPADVTLVAITKTHTIETVRAATALGIRDLGENRVQEAEGKIQQLERGEVRWHLVGTYNKTKRAAVELFDVIHSLIL